MSDSSRLTDEEIFVIFDVVDKRGNPQEAREEIHRKLHLRLPHRKTVTAVFNVGVELFKRGPNAADVLTNQEVDEIVEKASYGVSPSRVVDLHRHYLLWKAHKREAESEPEKYPRPEMEVTEMTTLPEKYLIDHYQKLHKVLEQFYDLRTPELSELCLFTLKDRVTVSYSYGEMRVPVIIYEKGAVKLDIEVSDLFLWGCLREHLVVEFPKFDENLSNWKTGVATIVEGCHNLTKTIANEFKERGTEMRWNSAKPYLSPDSKEYGPGVYYDLLASSIYECVIANQVPHFRRGYDSRELVIEGMKAIARGDDSLLDQVEQCCLDIIGNKTVKQKVKRLNLAKGEVESLQKSIKQNLRLALERGTFKETCSICSDLVAKSG